MDIDTLEAANYHPEFPILSIDIEKWISIKDILPKQDQLVLTYHPKCNMHDLCWFKKGKFLIYNSFPDYEVIKPTHWMPLLKAPK